MTTSEPFLRQELVTPAIPEEVAGTVLIEPAYVP